MWQRIAALVPKTWKSWLAWAIVFAAVYLVNHYLGSDIPEPAPPSFGKIAEGVHNFGWHHEPAEVKAVASTLPFKVFGDTPAGKFGDPLPPAVYLWQTYRK